MVSDLPTAVTVFNDRCASGILDVFARAGVRVPGDVSVVGFDDSRLARLAHIDLTTIAQDTATMARLAVGKAIGRIEGASAVRESVVPPRLVVRGTAQLISVG
jgi:DNA-binding LacI/PurR family transcriptional regulator